MGVRRDLTTSPRFPGEAIDLSQKSSNGRNRRRGLASIHTRRPGPRFAGHRLFWPAFSFWCSERQRPSGSSGALCRRRHPTRASSLSRRYPAWSDHRASRQTGILSRFHGRGRVLKVSPTSGSRLSTATTGGTSPTRLPPKPSWPGLPTAVRLLLSAQVRASSSCRRWVDRNARLRAPVRWWDGRRTAKRSSSGTE